MLLNSARCEAWESGKCTWGSINWCVRLYVAVSGWAASSPVASGSAVSSHFV